MRIPDYDHDSGHDVDFRSLTFRLLLESMNNEWGLQVEDMICFHYRTR